ncbi:helix-hairpin-helix domain-containing protein [Candidatus Leptofilum sp.]|uniref:helix-hairpin-helix domain-containing protein n=1 Tax=Candidatus Leptofilum sp. TaxID=3241576 RepID=UPI003B594305
MNYLLLATIFLQEAGTDPVGVPAWVPIVIGVILLLLFVWGLNRNNIPQGPAAEAEADDHHSPALHSEPHGGDVHHEETTITESPAPTEELAPMLAAKSAAVPAVEVELIEPDDLKKIEGIGPKIEGVLHEAGIFTFVGLAAATVEHLEKIVREDAGIRVAFPDTWPEQAQLAAAGEWEKLEVLQDDLKGGRRA